MNKFSASLNMFAFVNWPNGAVDEDHKKGDENRYKTLKLQDGSFDWWR